MADADLQLRGGRGGGGIQTLRKGVGPVSKKNCSGPFGPQFGLQIREAPPLDPPLALDMRLKIANEARSAELAIIISYPTSASETFFY